MNAGQNKKIVIAYATAGAGHKKAALAIKSAAKAFQLQPVLVDIVEFMPPLAKKLYSDGYAMVISRLPWLWAVLYRMSDFPLFCPLNVHLRRFLDSLMCRSFLDYLSKENPEIVISTQFLASEMVSFAKAKYGLKTRLVTAITDFGVHNFWVNPLTDLYCCAAETTKQILKEKGVPEKNIKVTGIPLDEKFLKVAPREDIRARLGLDAKQFTVLIATGGIGIGPIGSIVEKLKGKAQMIVVCGVNKKLQASLSALTGKGVKVFGFVDNMEELMAASDIMVTKAGGLSVTEAVNMSLPMVFFCLLPGQETINARTMASLGAGRVAKDADSTVRTVLEFKEDTALLDSCRSSCRSLAKPGSSSEILSLAISQ